MADISPETYKQYGAELNANPDFQYLKNYRFQGFINMTLDTWNKCLTNYFYDVILFRHGSSVPLTVDQMINYTISYMSCVTAVDLFAKTCQDTDHLFHGNQADYRLYHATYSYRQDEIALTFESVGAGVRQVFTWGINIKYDDYKEVSSPLDRRIEISGPGFGGRYLGHTVSCKELNFKLIEDLIQRMEY